MIRLKSTLILALLLGVVGLSAQDDRLSEKDVQKQGKYIEANRERLLGNHAKAIQIFESLLDNDPENGALHYELARTFQAIDELQRAITLTRRAVELEPDNQWYALFLGDLYQATGQDKRAAELYETLSEQYPEKEDYHYKWAYFLVRANEASGALKVYEIMEKRFGMSEELTRRKHTLYLGIGNFKKAEDELIHLTEAFPENTEYLHLLAGFYDQMEEPQEALQVYEYILEIDPSDTRAALAITERRGPASDDINYLRSLTAIFVKSDVALDVKMVQLIPYIQQVADTGDRALAEAALELCNVLDSVHPKEAKVYAAMGDLHYYSGVPKEALVAYEKALAEDESVYQVWEQCLAVCAELGEYDKLVEYSEASLDVFPNQARLYYFNGLGYFGRGDYASVLPSLEQGLLMTGRDLPLKFDMYSLLGKTYAATGNPGRSDDSFSRALELNPNAPAVLNAFSYSLAQRGEDLAKAKDLAARANELQPDQPQYQHTYGWVLYRLEEYQASRNWIGRALETLPEQPTLLEHYGDVLFQLGEEEEAIQYWEKAAKFGGSSELLERKIADRKLYE